MKPSPSASSRRVDSAFGPDARPRWSCQRGHCAQSIQAWCTRGFRQQSKAGDTACSIPLPLFLPSTLEDSQRLPSSGEWGLARHVIDDRELYREFVTLHVSSSDTGAVRRSNRTAAQVRNRQDARSRACFNLARFSDTDAGLRPRLFVPVSRVVYTTSNGISRFRLSVRALLRVALLCQLTCHSCSSRRPLVLRATLTVAGMALRTRRSVETPVGSLSVTSAPASRGAAARWAGTLHSCMRKPPPPGWVASQQRRELKSSARPKVYSWISTRTFVTPTAQC